jgi:hypothetical protein
MPLSVSVVENADIGEQCYRAVTLDDDPQWLAVIADEYVRLRSECVLPPCEVTLDGVQILSVARLQERLGAATLPFRRQDSFDVVRSDLGETVAYMLLEQEYRTAIGYKSVRDRETIQQPGRGLDVVGVESGDIFTLVIAEVKVSDERANPPQVVDRSDDSLRSQHAGHLADPPATAKKIWNQSRHVLDKDVRNSLFAAALLFEERRWDRLRLVACCVLLRPRECYAAADFGSFHETPEDYAPAQLRFMVVCLPDARVETTVAAWYDLVKQRGLAA